MAEGNVRIPYISEEYEEGTTGNTGLYISSINWSKNIINYRVLDDGGHYFCDIRPSQSNKVVVTVRDESSTKLNYPISLYVYKLNL